MRSSIPDILSGLACLALGLTIILRGWRLGDWICDRMIRMCEIMRIEDMSGGIPLQARQGLVFGLSIGGLSLVLFALGFFYQGYLAAHGIHKTVIR